MSVDEEEKVRAQFTELSPHIYTSDTMVFSSSSYTNRDTDNPQAVYTPR